MTGIDWGALVIGLASGAAACTAFFAGLAFGMRIALRAARPAAVLLLSAGLRITLLLGIGWFVAKVGLWAFVGYSVSFLLVRQLAIVLARPRALPGETPSN